jgi:hypothetical protein
MPIIMILSSIPGAPNKTEQSSCEKGAYVVTHVRRHDGQEDLARSLA